MLKYVMMFAFPVLFGLLPTSSSAKNGDISYWTKNLSEMKSGEITGVTDYNAELAVSGQTVHTLWMADSAYTTRRVFYRRYDLDIPAATRENQALKLDYFLPPNDDSGEERFDNMQIPPHDDLAFSSAFTTEMWFKLDGDAEMHEVRLLVKENETTFTYSPKGYQLGLHLSGDLYANGGVKTTTGEYMLWSGHAMVPETWTHLALTYDSTGVADNLRLYVNGELSVSATATGGVIGGDGILFVGAVRNYYSAQGAFDELRLWDRALPETEIRNNMSVSLSGSENGLVAYYPFNGTTRDMTGHGHDGILMYKESFVPSEVPTLATEETPAALPLQTALWPNYPNPFNPETEIAFSLSEKSKVTITVYNVLGQVVEVLLDREMTAGRHIMRWSGRDAASGVYFCRMKAGDFVQSRRMVLLK